MTSSFSLKKGSFCSLSRILDFHLMKLSQIFKSHHNSFPCSIVSHISQRVSDVVGRRPSICVWCLWMVDFSFLDAFLTFSVLGRRCVVHVFSGWQISDIWIRLTPGDIPNFMSVVLMRRARRAAKLFFKWSLVVRNLFALVFSLFQECL